jgi:cyclase
MNKWTFTKGLHELGKDIYAYIQPDGSWCLNNAGLIVDGQQSMLVDTLTDLAHTREMLDAIDKKIDALIKSVVITHGNIDHWLGNELVKDAEIIATEK